MPLQARVFTFPKDPEHPEQYEDAYTMDAAAGVAVVADGVASSLFSRHWAGILTKAVLADVPDPTNQDGFAEWIAKRRREWSEQIDTASLAWFQKAKLPVGAFSTLLWIRLLPVEKEEPGAFGASRLHGFAIGDSCLFHVRRGELVRTYPIQKAEDFQGDPLALGSVDLKRDTLLKFEELDVHCYDDDLLVLCTDAVAEWALRRIESGNPPAWDDYWNVTEEQWRAEITRLREDRQMRYDDATLLLLRVVPEGGAVEVVPLEEAPVTTETDETVEQPPAADTADDDWKEKFKSAGEQFVEGVELASDGALHGLKKWKKIAVRMCRDKFKKDGK